MCSDCREQGLHRKIAQFEEPRAVKRGTRKRSEKTASRKVLIDRLNAARQSLLDAVDRREQHGRDSWWAWGFEWSRKQYVEALQNCWKAGIEVKA